MQAPAIVGHVDKAHGDVRMHVALSSPVEDVWRALTDGERVARWLGRLDVDAVTSDGHFELWHDDVVRSRHAVLEWRPPHLLTVTWDFPDERASQVAFALAEADSSGATLSVHHQGLDDAVSYAAGWHRHLQYLEAHLRGDDLSIDDFWTGYDELVQLYDAQQRDPA